MPRVCVVDMFQVDFGEMMIDPHTSETLDFWKSEFIAW